jgi:HEAT repeat protein
MIPRTFAAVLLALALAAVAPAQEGRHYGWRPPPAVDSALAARTLQSAADWRQREEAAQRLGDSGDERWIGPLARAAADDPSRRVRQAARDAIDSIREANGHPETSPPPRSPPWGGGAVPSDPNADLIDSWYQRYLGRSVDPGGLTSRLDLLRRGTAPDDVEADIIGSGEYWERHGSNVVGFVQGLYADILDREANRDEVRIWADRYAVNRGNRSALAHEFLHAAAQERLDRRLP